MPHYLFIFPQFKRLTGAQRLILALAAALTRQGAQVTVLTHRFAPECRAALVPAVQLIESGVNLNRTGNHYLDSLIEYLAVPSLLAQLPTKTSSICFFGAPSLPGLWWAKHFRRLRLPLYYFCYEPPRAAYTDRTEIARRMGWLGWIFRPLFWLYRPVDRHLVRQAMAVLVNGKYGAELVRQFYNLPATIITHGVGLELDANPATIEQLRQQYGIGSRQVIITVNHLHPRKQIDILIRAMPAILQQQPDTTLLIVGQGAEETALKEIARSLNLGAPQVIFAGFIVEEALAAHFRLANIYAHAGRAETFGLSVLEAAACGLPVVATAEGGPLEIIEHGVTGYLIPSDSAVFSSTILQLLQQPELALQMGERAAASVHQHYSWELGAKAFMKIAGAAE